MQWGRARIGRAKHCANGNVMSSMKNDEIPENVTELQLKILHGLTDDYEDVEQLDLWVNRENEEKVQMRQLLDEILSLLRNGYIFAKYSKDEEVAPLNEINVSALHQYWFGMTDEGERLWKASQ
jgi:uncharacterized protein YehS (DUF1456 family)